MENLIKGFLIGSCLTHIIFICGYFLFGMMKYLAKKWELARERKSMPSGVKKPTHITGSEETSAERRKRIIKNIDALHPLIFNDAFQSVLKSEIEKLKEEAQIYRIATIVERKLKEQKRIKGEN